MSDIFQYLRQAKETNVLIPIKDFLPRLGMCEINSLTNSSGENLLHAVISSGQNEIAHYLIKNGIDVNHQAKKGSTPLHYVAIHGNLEIARVILDNGGHQDISDMYGNYPIWTAVLNANRKNKEYRLIKLLISRGADINHKNNANRSTLDFAHQVNDVELIGILTENA